MFRRNRFVWAVALAVAVFMAVGICPAPARGLATSQDEVLWTSMNIYRVQNGARDCYVFFTLEQDSVVTSLMTYHYLSDGAKPGQITLHAETGEQWGPFQAVGTDGQGSVKNANWMVDTGGLALPAGGYAIEDSDPSTWSNNADSGYLGMAEVRGYVKKAQGNSFATAAPPPAAEEMSGIWTSTINQVLTQEIEVLMNADGTGTWWFPGEQMEPEPITYAGGIVIMSYPTEVSEGKTFAFDLQGQAAKEGSSMTITGTCIVTCTLEDGSQQILPWTWTATKPFAETAGGRQPDPGHKESAEDGAAAAGAQQVADVELTLDFSFGPRTGRYTGQISGGLPHGSGTFVSASDEGDQWTYTGEWSNGHFDGYGTMVWADGWREEGFYANDYLNGEGAEYRGDTLYSRGIYEDNVLVQGQVFDELGNLYFEGAFEGGFRVESPAQQAVRLAAFFSEAVDDDYGLIWKDYDKYVGRKVVFAGKASYVWEGDEPAYQEFAIDVNNDPDEWIAAFGYMAKGEHKIAKGEKNVMVFGVLLEKYQWEDQYGKHSAPMVQFVGVQRLDFSCKTLKAGSKGSEVKALQTRLRELGYLPGKIDGAYGKGTVQSVSDFQQASGLPADGVASLKTLYLLFGNAP